MGPLCLAAKTSPIRGLSAKRNVYNFIFFTNVLRILDEQRLTRLDLSERSGVSPSFLSELTAGKGNPSLKVMEAISRGLNVPLATLLESSDWTQEELEQLAGGKVPRSLPPGFERVSVILPEHKAFIVRKWAEETRKKLPKHA